MLWVVFLGEARDRKIHEQAGESPAVITLPLVLLAVLSVAGGWHAVVPHFLNPGLQSAAPRDTIMAGFLAVPVVGFLLAWRVYGKAPADDAVLRRLLGPGYRWMENKFYFDEMYGWLVDSVQGTIALVCETFDRWIVRGVAVGGIAGTAWVLGGMVRLIQAGDLRLYILASGAGVVALLVWWLRL